jgi:CSLREA domain-containing protein
MNKQFLSFSFLAILLFSSSSNASVVTITFTGSIDFTSIGGRASEPFSIVFTYNTRVPPQSSGTIQTFPPFDFASYNMSKPDVFDMFGIDSASSIFYGIVSLQNTLHAVGSDFLFLDVSGPGIDIPNTNEKLLRLFLNSGAFPGNMIDDTGFPTNLNVAQSTTSLTLYAILDSGVTLSSTDANAIFATVIFWVNVSDDVDDGTCDVTHCSFREAINAANALPGTDTIAFNIPGAGPHTIQPLSALPTITDSICIDGTTQPGFAGSPVIELDGSKAGAVNGLDVTAGNSVIRGLVLNRFGAHGITLSTNGGNVVEGNFIGTDVTGTTALGNAGHGVSISQHASGNTIGGLADGASNIIAFNGGHGLFIASSSSVRNAILTNAIFSNTGLGIDLLPDGANPNDAGDSDTGANNRQNFPILTAATSGSTALAGTLNSSPNTTFRLVRLSLRIDMV